MGDWRHRAACVGKDLGMWFYDGRSDSPGVTQQIVEAKAVCGGCPVQKECLNWALDVQAYGIAGGLTEDERCKVRTAMGLPPRPRGHSETWDLVMTRKRAS